jgi:hypothetical protein
MPRTWRGGQAGEPPCAVSAWRASERLFRRQQAPMPGTKPASIAGSPPSRRQPPEPAFMANLCISPVLSSREQLRRPGASSCGYCP